MRSYLRFGCLIALGLWPALAMAGPRDEEEEPPKRKVAAPAASPAMETVYDFDADVLDAEMLAPSAAEFDMPAPEVGVTAGGIQDVDHARDRIEAGEVPLPEHFSGAGLLSEHDLPSPPGRACEQTICVRAQTTETTMIVDPTVHYLVQLGFGSNLDASQIERPRLNLVVVVDLSTSMTGTRETVVEGIRALAEQLGDGDQLSIVAFRSKARVVLAPTAMPNPHAVESAAASLQPGGGTGMERGLYAGFEVARRSGRGFGGASRVVLFTDGRPNVGRIGPGTFMGLAKTGASEGIGLTTVGVGAHFDAPLAQAISSVRGGNAFFLRSPAHARAKFDDQLDTMVTELAYDMRIVVDPAPGMRVVDVYGIPSQLIERPGDGDGIALGVETLFLSRKQGAIYVSLAPKGRLNLPRKPMRVGKNLGLVRVDYEERSGRRVWDHAQIQNVAPAQAGVGLRRGTLLVDQLTVTAAVAELVHVKHDGQAAWSRIHALAERYRADQDPELAEARALMLQLERNLAAKTGHSIVETAN